MAEWFVSIWGCSCRYFSAARTCIFWRTTRDARSKFIIARVGGSGLRNLHLAFSSSNIEADCDRLVAASATLVTISTTAAGDKLTLRDPGKLPFSLLSGGLTVDSKGGS